MADRYTYLPSVGIAVMLAWGISSLIKSEDLRKKILFPSGIAVLAIIAVLTWKQCSYWKNSIELFKQALQVTEANYKAHANLGLALFNEGKIEEAIDHYNQAIRIEPNYNQAYYNRGTIYTKLGQYQRAIKDYNEAIRIKPDYSISYNNRGAAYLLQGNNALGCRDVQKACELGICKTLEAAKSNGICR
jgi:tetratricopeptide (TPR) repeat protein